MARYTITNILNMSPPDVKLFFAQLCLVGLYKSRISDRNSLSLAYKEERGFSGAGFGL